jgi:hypothetical protein
VSLRTPQGCINFKKFLFVEGSTMPSAGVRNQSLTAALREGICEGCRAV